MLNELRRNPFTRKWIVYLTGPGAMKAYLERLESWRSSLPEPPENGDCFLCPGREEHTGPAIRLVREGEILLPRELHRTGELDWQLRVVPNPDPLFGLEGKLERSFHRIYDRMTGRGAHELIVEHPDHLKTLWDMGPDHLELLLLLVRERFRDLRKDPQMGHLIWFRGCGPTTGVRYRHPHSQIMASPFVPEKVQKELRGAHLWHEHKERCLFCDILGEELRDRQRGHPHRLVLETERFVAMVPYFASHAFEVWLLPRFHQYDFRRLEPSLVPELAQALRAVLDRIRSAVGWTPLNLYLLSSPNRSWGRARGYWEHIREDWHWRLSLIPRLPAEIHGYRDFFMGTGTRVNPVLPEQAAERLRGSGSLG